MISRKRPLVAVLFVLLACVRPSAEQSAGAAVKPPAPGFTLTFDGGIFKQETIFLKATPSLEYSNAIVRWKSRPGAERLDIVSDTRNDMLRVAIEIKAGIRVGTLAYDRKDEDDPSRKPNVGLFFGYDDWARVKGYRFDLLHLDVVIAKLEPPGGRIEGTLLGTFELCTLPGDGGGNCTARAPLKLSGSFSVVREKDRLYE